MLKTASTSVVALIATFLAAAPASATDIYHQGSANDLVVDAPAPAKSWTGPYIGIGVGYEAFRTEGSFEYDTFEYHNGKGHYHKTGTEAFGYDTFDGNVIVTGRIGYDQQSGQVVFGAFVEGNWLNIDSALGDAEWSYAGGGRLGLLCGGALCYLNGGWEFIELDGADIDNPFAGAGLEAQLGSGFSGALEARYSFREEDKLGVEVKDTFSARLMLLKKFN